MREILFRGKRLDNGEWVEGCFVEKKDPLLGSDVRNAFILAQARGDSFVTWFPVDPTTVGQFTGLLDKNGKRIFEGDVVAQNWYDYDEPSDDSFGEVVFCEYDCSFSVVDKKKMGLCRLADVMRTIGKLRSSATSTTAPNCWR